MPQMTDRVRKAVAGYLAAGADWITAKMVPAGVGGAMPGFMPTADSFRRRAQPTRRALLDSLRGFAYACASKNANGIAQVPLRLYVQTNEKEGHRPVRKCWNAVEITDRRREYLRWSGSPDVQKFVSRSDRLEEITTHPILEVLKAVNPWMNQYDLLRLLSIEMDVTGEAYWFTVNTVLGGVPGQIWPLESWRIRPIPSLDGSSVVQSYEYNGPRGTKNYSPDDLIQFRVVSPHDPYGTGFSPMRAAFEYVELANELLAYEAAVVNNRARPDMIISPRDMMSRSMAERMEQRINNRFRRGGGGGVLVGEFGLDYHQLALSPTDMGATNIRRACEEVIAACFDVPLSLVRVEDVNRANAEAGQYAHATLAIRPRCCMIEQKLNEKFTPLFGGGEGRLILAFDNPVPEDRDRDRADMQANLDAGLTSHNEERKKRGLPDIPGGEEPLINPQLIPISRLRDMVQGTLDQMQSAIQQARTAEPPPGRPGSRMSKVFRRMVVKRIDREVERKFAARMEEERLARGDRAASEWPDLPFQG